MCVCLASKYMLLSIIFPRCWSPLLLLIPTPPQLSFFEHPLSSAPFFVFFTAFFFRLYILPTLLCVCVCVNVLRDVLVSTLTFVRSCMRVRVGQYVLSLSPCLCVFCGFGALFLSLSAFIHDIYIYIYMMWPPLAADVGPSMSFLLFLFLLLFCISFFSLLDVEPDHSILLWLLAFFYTIPAFSAFHTLGVSSPCPLSHLPPQMSSTLFTLVLYASALSSPAPGGTNTDALPLDRPRSLFSSPFLPPTLPPSFSLEVQVSEGLTAAATEGNTSGAVSLPTFPLPNARVAHHSYQSQRELPRREHVSVHERSFKNSKTAQRRFFLCVCSCALHANSPLPSSSHNLFFVYVIAHLSLCW